MLVSLGRFDVDLGVAAMSSFRVTPRLGHLDNRQQIMGHLLCLLRAYGYLKHIPSGSIHFRVKIPNHENFATPIYYDWI